MSWGKLEKTVREIASIRYGTPCDAIRHDNGINHDAVCKINEKHWVIIEITKNQALDKIRGDISRLELTRTQLFTQKHIMCECIMVVGFDPTPSMLDAAKASGMEIFSSQGFISAFYSKSIYKNVRISEKFGSAVDIISGEPDKRPYVPVAYDDKVRARSYNIKEIADNLHSGKNVVLTGTFGSGKSRCCKELFECIADKGDFFCVSIDLRDVGALASAQQILRAHFEELGIEGLSEAAIRLLNSGKFIVLLDGFDEMGGAQWSDDPHKLKEIRRRILRPVREIVEKSHASFISGREHYFNSDEELIDSLGIKEVKDILLECREEFSGEEILNFLKSQSAKISLPEWLPRRPLLYQIIVELHADGFPVALDKADGHAELWQHISTLICRREARINANFEEKTIFEILKKLGRESRTFAGDVEPVTLDSLKAAYKSARGYEPADEDTVLLQKLPGLGRISYDSRDRRFVDKYLADGFRASDLNDLVDSQDASIVEERWLNPLDALGLSVVAKKISDDSSFDSAIGLAKRCAVRGNSVMAADIISALGFSDAPRVDCGGAAIQGATISLIDLSSSEFSNISFEDCIIHRFHSPDYEPDNVIFRNCIIDFSYGISNEKGIPKWMYGCEINNYEKIDNIASIKNLKLSPSQRILCVILHKTFFQPGRGRQEEALLRGLGQIDRTGITKSVLRILARDGFLIREKGRHGALYIPVIAKKPIAAKLLNLQVQSGEAIWNEISQLN